MIEDHQAGDIIGSTAHTGDGDKIGTVGQLLFDDRTGRPEFVTVGTGLFGRKETYVPVANATLTDDGLVVPFTRATVKSAPAVDLVDGHLSEDDVRRLHDHYAQARSADDTMTVSEEHLQVGTQTQDAGRARLRKDVVTEVETATMPVAHERAVVTFEPVADADLDLALDTSLDGVVIAEAEHEVVLHAETPVVAKETVPVERVRLGTETVDGLETVTDQVRTEHVEVEVEGDELG